MTHIVSVEERHLDDIERIERECFSLPWMREQLRHQMGDGHIFICAENENGRAVGYVGLMYVLDEGYISNVAVSGEFRRQGIADALLDELRRRGEAKGLSFMTLEVRAGNAPARALYAKHGYRDVGLRKNYYERPREDAVLMTLYLNEA